MADNFSATLYLRLEMFHEKMAIFFAYPTHASRVQGTIEIVIALHNSSILFLFHLNTLCSLRTWATKFGSKRSIPQKEGWKVCLFVSQLILTFSANRFGFSYPRRIIHTNRCFSTNRPWNVVHSCQQKSIGLKFSESRTGSDVRYSCHHNSSRFTFPIFAHSCRFSVLHSLQSITPRIY